MKKSTRFAALFMASILLLAGCTSGETAESADGIGREAQSQSKSGKENANASAVKDSLVIALHEEPPSLSPVDNDALTPIYINLLTNNLLFKIDMETLEVEPDLCESYEQVSDTEYLFKLREGVMFHHGKELDAEDVVASIENAKEYPASEPYTKEIASVEAVDKY